MLSSEQIDNWIAALRSGNYPQATGCLRSDNGYCCLGVLADLNGAEWIRMAKLSRFNAKFGEDEYVSSIPDTFLTARWINRLIDLNDCKHAPFSEIADFIEENRYAFTRAD